MHLRLDDLRKQARMLQMYERSRTRPSEAGIRIQASEATTIKGDSAGAAGSQTGKNLADPLQPID